MRSRIQEAGQLAMRSKLVLFLTLCPIFANSAPAQMTDSLPSVSPDIRDSRKHLHDKDDVGRIGHRNLGHTGFGNWYSLDSEIALGKEYSAVVERNLKTPRRSRGHRICESNRPNGGQSFRCQSAVYDQGC